MTPFSAPDISFHRVISGLDAVPPSGDVIYLVKRPDVDLDSYRTSLWHFPDGRPQRLVGSGARPSSVKLARMQLGWARELWRRLATDRQVAVRGRSPARLFKG